jgi:hypothetical protein
MKEYIQPQHVTAPRLRWSLIKLLYPGKPETYSIALGRWDGDPAIGIRWNACEDRPVGSPSSRGLATWFIVPGPLVDAVLSVLDLETQSFVRNLIPKS